MKLAFNGQGRYTDFDEGYRLYVKRSKKGEYVDGKTYNRIIRQYCKLLSDKLFEEGIVDLPEGMGSIAAAILTRKPQFRGKTFVGYGKMDWQTGHYDGKLKTFGIVYLPRHDKNPNLRSFGFVANRRLFQKVKERYEGYDCPWRPIEFNDEMI